MYAAEQLFQALTYEELYYTLKSIVENDCYIDEFLDSEILEDFLYMLDTYDITYIASDDRVLLTSKGEKVLQYISTIVELEDFSNKVKRKKKL
jgi:hypothetical protein